MENFDEVILNPFSDSIVPMFIVMHVFHGEFIGPVHSSLVIIIDKGCLRIVGKGSDSNGEAVRDITNRYCDFYAFAGCTDFGFTRAEEGAFLVDSFPSDKTPHIIEDNATHTAKLEQGECHTMADCISNLRAPICVTIGG